MFHEILPNPGPSSYGTQLYRSSQSIIIKLQLQLYAPERDTDKNCVYLRRCSRYKYLQMVSSRLVDAAAMMNGNVSGIAPLKNKQSTGNVSGIAALKNKLSTAGSTVEENHDVSLQIEAIEEGGGFVNRILSREEGIGHSSRSYYRAPVQGRVPFDWEAEPGKPKTGVRKKGESGHGIPALSPPPILQARNVHNLRKSSSGRRKVGLFQKIKDFLQGKTLAKSTKLRQRQRQGSKDKMRSESVAINRTRPGPESGGSDWEIYGDIEEDSDFAFRHSVS
jgi:hypothetical protein